MNVFDVRNNHLKRIIHDILNFPDDSIDESLIYWLERELILSTFICPDCGAGLLMAGDPDGGKALPAFTGMGEFDVEFANSNIMPASFEFNQVRQYLYEEDFEGIVINPHIDDFFVSRDIISDALKDYPSFTNYNELKSELTDDELLEIFHEENPQIDECMLQEKFTLEDLIMRMSEINLFSFITSPDDCDEVIISHDAIASTGILTINEFGGEYSLIFNSHRHMRKVKQYYDNDERKLYALPTTLELMAKYALELDLDGLIVNYGFESFVLSRELLQTYLPDIVDGCRKNIKYTLWNYVFNIVE